MLEEDWESAREATSSADYTLKRSVGWSSSRYLYGVQEEDAKKGGWVVEEVTVLNGLLLLCVVCWVAGA